MKKMALLIIVALILSTASYALTPGKLTAGINTAIVNLGVLSAGSLTFGYDVNKDVRTVVGLAYNSYKTQAGVTTSQTGYALEVDYMLPIKLGSSAASPFAGLKYSSDGATATTTMLALVLGAEVPIADGVTIGVGLIPYAAATTAGASDTSMGTGSDNTCGRGLFISGAFSLN